MIFDEMPCYFLGANGPKGYFSRFDQLFSASPSGKCFLLKGGPGTGKSTVLKKVAEKLKEKDLSTELIFCSADVNSLDAVITSDGKIAALDATLPHAVEPKYPGIYEKTVSLFDCWNEEKLFEHRRKAAELFDENRKNHEQARRYIAAAAGLFEEAARLEKDCIYQEKAVRTATRICLREFGKRRGTRGKEKERFLSAITDEGVCFFDKTAKLLCKKIYLFNDEYGAASRIFMSTVRKLALEHGYDIVICRCPIFPQEKIEHIFIPEIGLGFMTGNKRHKINIIPYRVIHAKRFFDEKKYLKNKIRMRFAVRYATSLVAEAAECMKEAKKVHDELEKIYIAAMDFKKVDEKLEKILEEI